jgi:N-acetylglucosaminyldiphosphoundecaprenol N-acetyl-beta-D-mannosaminyltransferase
MSPEMANPGGRAVARPVHELFGVPICALRREEALSAVDDAVRTRVPLLIGVVNAAKLVNMRRDEQLRRAVLGAHMILADGMSVVWASRVLRKRLPERVTGIDLMTEMLRRGQQRGYRIYFLGATDEVLQATVEHVNELYPGVIVAGKHHGYFGPDDEETVAEDIRRSRADILLAAMSSPKKELFLARWWPTLNVPVCHGVGGAFDVVAGKVQRAPAIWQRLGLEWLYRVLQEPRRLWKRYLVTNSLFCGMVLSQLVRPRSPGAPDGHAAPAPRRAAEFNVELITSRAALEQLSSEWNRLLEESPVRSIFLTWEWIQAWLDAVGPDVRLRIVVIRDARNELAAIGPFYATRLTLLRMMPYRCLRVLGDAASGSEYGNIIARSDVAEAASEAVLGFLARNRRLWDAIWLANMGPTPDRADALMGTAARLGMYSRSREAEFSRISLPPTFDEYLGGLPGKIRYQMRKGVERLREGHRATLATCTGTAGLDDALTELFRLHAARWSRRGERGVFADSSLRPFYRALGQRMTDRGWFRLDRACVDGRAVAAQIGFAYGDVFYELQRGFDPGFPNIPAGLGAALRSIVLQRCCEEGIRTYDFLGGFAEDKNRAGAQRVCGRDVLIVRPSIMNRVLFRSNAWPTGKYLRFPKNEAATRGHPRSADESNDD